MLPKIIQSGGGKRGGSHFTVDEKGDVGGSGLTYLTGNLTVDGVADDHIAEIGTVLRRPKIERLDRKLVETLSEGDHAGLFGRGHACLQAARDRVITKLRAAIGIGEELSVRSGQGEEVTTAISPKLLAAILNRMCILSGHQVLQAGQIGQQRCFAAQHAIALISQVAKCTERMVQVGLETLADFLLDGDPDDEETSDGKPQRNRQERYHQSCPHPPLFHESTISFTTPVASIPAARIYIRFHERCGSGPGYAGSASSF